MKKTLPLFLITLLILIATTSIPLQITKASPTTELKVINTTTGDSTFYFEINTTNVGDTFIANVTVFDVANLSSWQLNVTWDPSMLDLLSMTLPPDHVFSDWMYYTAPTKPDINHTAGYVIWSVLSAFGQPTFNGTGTLAQLEFNITRAPNPGQTLKCSITIDTEGDFYSYLLDPLVNELPFTPTDGDYQYEWYVERPPATLSVNPPRVVDPTLTPCHNFTVNITVTDVTDLYGFEFTLSFNASLLNVQEAQLGDFFPPITPTIDINNVAGYITMSASLTPPEPSRNGTGTLATITFHVEALGSCNLTLYPTSLTDPYGTPIDHEAQDGYFNNMLIAKLAVDPPEIIDPTLVPPKTFQVNITLDDVENLCQYSFALTYDPEILACIGIVFMDALNMTNYTADFNISNTEGFMWINVTYTPPPAVTTYEPVTLFTLTFRVEAIGSTPISFQNATLTDCTGQPISDPETHDGFFQSVMRDIAVTDVSVTPTEIYPSWTVYINVTVKNKGDLNENFTLDLYYGPPNNLINTTTITNLMPNESRTLFFLWDTSSVNPSCNKTTHNYYNYSIWAEASAVPYETNLADNILYGDGVKVKIMGDINGDGIVDALDIALVVNAFGSKPGQPRWNPNADLNQDGKVDGKDIATTIYYYGTSC